MDAKIVAFKYEVFVSLGLVSNQLDLFLSPIQITKIVANFSGD